MFGFHKKSSLPGFDAAGKTPLIRASICTGEQVAGFRDPVTGKFTELMLIRNDRDLEEFTRTYGVRREDIKREW